MLIQEEGFKPEGCRAAAVSTTVVDQIDPNEGQYVAQPHQYYTHDEVALICGARAVNFTAESAPKGMFTVGEQPEPHAQAKAALAAMCIDCPNNLHNKHVWGTEG